MVRQSIGISREFADDRSAAHPTRRSWRAKLVQQVTLWHWLSSAVCLGGILLFTVTGITLNHAETLSAKPKILRKLATLPLPLQAELQQRSAVIGQSLLPATVAVWLEQQFAVSGIRVAEWNQAELYVSLPRPGGDAWLRIDRETGQVEYEQTDRGWLAYANDLHKGRHTGAGWNVYIDILAFACLVFTLTGIFLLQTHAAKRPATWPAVALSLLAPLAIVLFFAHP